MILHQGELPASTISSLRVHTAPRWLNVCDIKAPRTGLEVKFSYAFLAAMALQGINLAAYESYDDAVCVDRALTALAGKIEVIPNDQIADSATLVEIDLVSGKTLSKRFDLLAPLDHEQLGIRLQAKAAALIGADRAKRIWSMFDDLTQVSAVEIARQLQA